LIARGHGFAARAAIGDLTADFRGYPASNLPHLEPSAGSEIALKITNWID
jgi:hypothetical protein